MKLLKQGLSIRGDSYYCPLAFSLDTYWNCETNCAHCYLRRMNRTWGDDLRPLDLELFKKKLINGLSNKNPKTSLAHALKQKKTIRVGNKTDPYQTINNEYRVTEKAIKILMDLDWSIVIQTKFTANMIEEEEIFKKSLVTMMPIISPGGDRDWEILEHKKTTRPISRMYYISQKQKEGFNVGVNGEPFIGGWHTIKDVEDTLKLLKSYGIKSYNTYNLHLNDWNAKQLNKSGLDIEAIWYYNQDARWRINLEKILDLGKKYDIIMGCPDFINSGKYVESVNTCCGIHVPNPCTFNTLNWKQEKYLKGRYSPEVIDETFDGVGDYKTGKSIYDGTKSDFFTMKDIL